MLKIAYHEAYQHSLPDGHRFPMKKYGQIRQQLMAEPFFRAIDFFEPAPCDDEILLLTHTGEYLTRLNTCSLDGQMIRKIGFPLTPELVVREKIIMQGTIDCALYALKNGVSLNIAGGTHHAFSDRGEGFCLLNDLAVAANYLLHHQLAKKILIVDLDVHQGNGTASIFRDNPKVITFSMHGKNNYPFQKEKSDLDIELEDRIEDAAYLELLSNGLTRLLTTHHPDFIFYQSGVDVLKTDKFGKLGITPDGCTHRDEYLFGLCRELNIPVVAAMGGGYSPELKDIVSAHCTTFKTAATIFLTKI